MIDLRLDDLARIAGGSLASTMPAAAPHPNRPERAPHAKGGRAGLGAGSGARVTGLSTDTRTLRAGDVFVALAGENFDGHRFVGEAFDKGALAAVVSRVGMAHHGRVGIAHHNETAGDMLGRAHPTPLIVVDDTRAALQRLAVHHRRRLSAKVIAVTGSNGKTTTKGMIDHVLGSRFCGRAAPRSFNNHVGVPLTVLSADPADDYLVVEIGSSAPGEVAGLAQIAAPDAGVVTSIAPAHLEGLGDLEGVAREKLSLLDHVEPGGLGVMNARDLRQHGCCRRWEALEITTIGTNRESHVRVTDVQSRLDGVTFLLDERHRVPLDAPRPRSGPVAGRPAGFARGGVSRVRLPVPGAHNAENAAAAFAVARWMGLEPKDIVEALSTVSLPERRLHVHRLAGLTLIEDCYNANPASFAAALDVLGSTGPRRRVLIAGQMMELGLQSEALHRQVGALAARAGVDLLIAVGPSAGAMAEAARSVRPSMVTYVGESTERACDGVPTLLGEGDTVLIKGSRAMRLERLTERIVERFSTLACLND